MKGPIILIVGTRPEGIKMIPLYFALKNAGINTLLCSTMQHDELLSEVFDVFGVKPDFDLGIMRLGQDLFYLTQSILQKTKELFSAQKPSLVIVQGDTTSTMAAAMSAFYMHIPVAHVEAGLRTDDIYSPFPEEMNRRFVSTIASYHFAPTSLAVQNLLAQGVDASTVLLTGNTAVDALRIVKDKIDHDQVIIKQDLKNQIHDAKQAGKKIIVLTAHRRESFDGGLLEIMMSVKQFLLDNPGVICFYPFHPNPQVISAINQSGLSQLKNIYLSEPITYTNMVYLLSHADVVLTDSGGIQEEAISLAKPCLVLRKKTERMEGVLAGLAHIVGTDSTKIISTLNEQLKKTVVMRDTCVYGDGYAAQKIVTILTSSMNALDYRESIDTANTVTIHQHYQKKECTMKKICMIGLGYIGLPTAIVAAENSFDVMGFDVDSDRVKKINAGDPVIHEPEVFEKLQLALGSGNFKASTTLCAADFFVIAVPTPFKDNKLADLSHVYDAGQQVARVLKKGNVVILESTIPVGTTAAFAKFLEEKTHMKAGTDFYVAHCPERVLPGKIFQELIQNDRIIGGINQESVEQAKEMYKAFVKGHLYLTDATTAEMVKLVENSSRDVQIAFANQVASMAYSVGLNPYEVIELSNKHPRVNILNPGCGVGGHCIAVDPWFLVESFPHHSQLLKAARIVNDSKPLQVINCVQSAVAEWQKNNEEKRAKVAVFGLTYKPDVDDLRESPALLIAKQLRGYKHIDLLVCEPHVNKNKLADTFGDTLVNATQALEQADIVLFLVGHTRFKALDNKQIQSKKVLDFCGLLYQPQKETTEQEHMFWPAQSMMDFFAVSSHGHPQVKNKMNSEETA
ncbi:MAG: UDP-N-acetyl-D-mannosamine dehydrogenase [Candidatus Babeliales bacterium]|nr:UDP-N-acetyl-D-mannosamine dehydrogenase [Candidatus Babeliales bacterium]